MIRKFVSLCPALIMAALVAGCAYITPPAPRATVATIRPSGNPAKPADCNMPVLSSIPRTKFREVALIDAVGSVYATQKDVMPIVKRKACELGADAVVINQSIEQRGTYTNGYYINAVAIIYVNKDHGGANSDAAGAVSSAQGP